VLEEDLVGNEFAVVMEINKHASLYRLANSLSGSPEQAHTGLIGSEVTDIPSADDILSLMIGQFALPGWGSWSGRS
jgi:hypothetical protein